MLLTPSISQVEIMYMWWCIWGSCADVKMIFITNWLVIREVISPKLHMKTLFWLTFKLVCHLKFSFIQPFKYRMTDAYIFLDVNKLFLIGCSNKFWNAESLQALKSGKCSHVAVLVSCPHLHNVNENQTHINMMDTVCSKVMSGHPCKTLKYIEFFFFDIQHGYREVLSSKSNEWY